MRKRTNEHLHHLPTPARPTAKGQRENDTSRVYITTLFFHRQCICNPTYLFIRDTARPRLSRDHNDTTHHSCIAGDVYTIRSACHSKGPT